MATGDSMERKQIPLPQHADNKLRRPPHLLLLEAGYHPPKKYKKKAKRAELNISNLLMFPSSSSSLSSLGKFLSSCLVEKCQMSLWVKLTQIYDD